MQQRTPCKAVAHTAWQIQSDRRVVVRYVLGARSVIKLISCPLQPALASSKVLKPLCLTRDSVSSMWTAAGIFQWNIPAAASERGSLAGCTDCWPASESLQKVRLWSSSSLAGMLYRLEGNSFGCSCLLFTLVHAWSGKLWQYRWEINNLHVSSVASKGASDRVCVKIWFWISVYPTASKLLSW